jgi:hypothetical protein
MPPKAQIYFNDNSRPLYWEHSWGNLIKMVYNNENITPLYASLGDAADPKIPDTIFLNMENRHLVDRTAEFHADPLRFLPFSDSTVYKLSVPTPEIAADRKFEIVISGAHDVDVRIAYGRDDSRIEILTARVNEFGLASAALPMATKGIYRIVGFQIAGHTEWTGTNNTITVH